VFVELKIDVVLGRWGAAVVLVN